MDQLYGASGFAEAPDHHRRAISDTPDGDRQALDGLVNHDVLGATERLAGIL
jgi:hypothetical protein